MTASHRLICNFQPSKMLKYYMGPSRVLAMRKKYLLYAVLMFEQ